MNNQKIKQAAESASNYMPIMLMELASTVQAKYHYLVEQIRLAKQKLLLALLSEKNILQAGFV